MVLIGGAGPEFSYQALDQAVSHLQRGARLVAMHRGLYRRTSEGLQLDTGAFLAGLEQAAGTEAEVAGKPAPAFFAAAPGRRSWPICTCAAVPLPPRRRRRPRSGGY